MLEVVLRFEQDGAYPFSRTPDGNGVPNLIGNATQYRGKEAPVIVIEAAKMAGEWQVTVRDNV